MDAVKGTETHLELIIHFDGSCMPKNPGGVARYGFHIDTPAGVRVAEDSQEVCRGPEATNNVAEWAGLRAALRHVRTLKCELVTIKGDSKLVICQLNGEWQCKKSHLLVYLNDCLNILEDFRWRAEWVPRAKNSSADILSRGPK